MSRRRPPTLKLLTIAVLAVLPVLSAHAGEPQSQDRGSQQRDDSRDNRQDSRSSLSDAVRRVERDTRGEVLSAERVPFDGREMHRVKVVDDQGRVRVFMQDPQRSRNDDAGTNRNNNRGASNRQKPTRDDDD
ncbi:hypothetical protein [Thermomonas sp. HDW16]|uniref:PepSY domain-containing protein n=1 Tax=Thermomonas sp. HDW16 TaxID=2714945 RepID=UPI001F103950|nr:hypothetical protein [Thermomonas sp. HDW16]